jgi:hypothetical protein
MCTSFYICTFLQTLKPNAGLLKNHSDSLHGTTWRRRKEKGGFLFIFEVLNNTASSVALQLLLCRKTLGTNLSLLRLWHCQPDALTTRLDLIHFFSAIDLIYTRLDLIHFSDIDLIYTRLDLIHCSAKSHQRSA